MVRSMFSNYEVDRAPGSRLRDRLIQFAGCALLLFGATASAHAQFNDTPALHPPAGVRVAMVEFSDLQCPACAQANPLLIAAAAKYKIPWVRHDFLIPYHAWSFNAAIKARWFDSKSKALGDQYRDAVFANQNEIYNLGMLSQFTEKFAQSHRIAMPAAIDPEGKFAAAVQADNALGKSTGIMQTPTVFIVIANGKGAPYIRVTDFQSQLDAVIAQALADTRGH
jgi:protein-disulfide isomerase